MKKVGVILLMVFCMVGCGYEGEKPMSDVTALEVDQSESEAVQLETEVDVQDTMPEWILPYSELGEKENPIHLGDEKKKSSFDMIDHRLQFPESNIIIVAGETYGTDQTIIKNKSEELLEIIHTIEKENIIDDESAKNPDAILLGHTLSIVLQNANSEYILVKISSFNDDRHYIDIICENSMDSQAVFIKSQELTKLLQGIIQYKVILFNNIRNTESLTLINYKNNTEYNCSQEEVQRFGKFLNELENEKNGLCSGPFDVSIILKADNEYISMKWSNDGCGLLAVEGKCYEVVGKNKEWLEDIISAHL